MGGKGLTMRILFFAVNIVAAALLIVPAASAQVGPVGLIQMPPLFGDFKPSDGSWAEYKVLETDSDSIMNITVALLSREKCATSNADDKKKDCYWVEVVTQLPDGPSAAVKIYSAGDPRDVKNFRRLLNRAGKRPPVEAKPESLAKLNRIPGGPLPAGARTKDRKDTVNAAGEKIISAVSEFRFDGIPYVLWSSDRVPLFGMVKLQAPNLKIELVKFGKSFKTTFPEIKEIPKKDQTLDRPEPIDVGKPDKTTLEEDKGKLQDDYKGRRSDDGEKEKEEDAE
jgi:hypothetical protein